MTIKKLGIGDMELILNLRIDYLLADRGPMTQEEQNDIKYKMKAYVEKWLPNNSFMALIAEEDDVVLSTAFLSIVEKPPRIAFQSYLVGTIYNVLTYPDFRKKGIASKVLSALLKEARAAGVSYMDLMATNDGKYLYEKMGFQINNYTPMRITLK